MKFNEALILAGGERAVGEDGEVQQGLGHLALQAKKSGSGQDGD